MKALLAFSGGGGAGFPGSPVAGVYITATAPEFLTVCASVVATAYSIVTDGASGGVAWYSDGAQMVLLGGSASDFASLPSPGTAGGVTFAVGSDVALYNIDDSSFYYFDGAAWQALA